MRRSYIVAALSLVSATLMLSSSCGPGLPSRIGLGGIEQATLEEHPPRRPRADTQSEIEEADSKGEGGAPAVDDEDPEDAGADDGILTETDAGSDALPADASVDAATPMCDDTTATMFDCDAIQGDCRFMFTRLCEGANGVLKAKVAAHFGRCLEGIGSQCDPMAMLVCFKEAAQRACPVPSAKQVCAGYLARCGQVKELPEELGADFCEQALSSLKDDLRAPMEGCMNQGCDIGECVKRHLPSP